MMDQLFCIILFFCGVSLLKLISITTPFLLVLVINEYFDKYTDWPREIHRKFGHVCSGLLIIAASFYLNYPEMILFSFVLIAGALGTRILKFKSVNEVTRKTIGTTLFAVVVLVLTLMWFQERPELLRYGIWILTIPDALAAVIGSQWGTYLEEYGKSYLGSFVFFVSVFILSFIFSASLVIALVLAVILTLMEFLTTWGLDNLTMPLTGSILLFLLI